MGSVTGVNYDFKMARSRIAEWKTFYRRMKRMGLLTPHVEMDIKMLVNDLEREIQEAHESVKGKMATARNSNHPVIHIEKIINPIVAHWGANEKPEFYKSLQGGI